jgi:predicted N-acetyltransferase YhbS
MLSTRPAAAPDVAEIEAIVAAAFGIYRSRMDCDPAPMTADYPALVAAGQVWVALEDDQIVGLIVLAPAADHLYLDTVAVRPGSQGSGVGRRLLALAESEAARRGLPAVVLCTNAVMTENLAYYPRRGYRLTHRRRQDGFSRVFFRKDLPAPPP